MCDGKYMRARENIQGTNLHVLHIKNASLDILISYSYEELLQMKWNDGVGEWDEKNGVGIK